MIFDPRIPRVDAGNPNQTVRVLVVHVRARKYSINKGEDAD